MARVTPIQNAFNGGELSPLLAGRSDVAKYQAGCNRLENFLPTIEGPCIARPGTIFTAEVKNSTHRTWLVPFAFSETDSYMLEFGDGYIRFFFNHGAVQISAPSAWVTTTAYVIGDLVSNAGTNYYCEVAHTAGTFATDLASGYWHALTGTTFEVPSPYDYADLTNADGSFALDFVQSGDVVRFVGGGSPPYKLSRLGPTYWTMVEASFNVPPFEAENITATTIYASAATGTVTLTSSATFFTAPKLNRYLLLRERDVRDTKQWEAGKSITAGDLRRSDGRNYKALNTATTGGYKPTHVTGAQYDGDTGVQWEFQDNGYGWVKITALLTGTTATAEVMSRLPSGCVGSGQATARWALSAWSSATGWPTSITYFRERLVMSRDSTLWFSVGGDYENFAYDIDGDITADAGFERTLSSDRVNVIRWLSSGDVLLVGTIGDEWAVTQATVTDPFGPANCQTKRQSTYGSSNVKVQRIGAETLFVQASGRKVRAMPFEFGENGTQSPNICDYARTIAKSGIVSMSFQQEPWSVLWAVRSDGVLIGATFDRVQDVVAWHRHPFYEGIAECVASIPAPDGSRDDLWLIVRYTVNGATRRYIAYLATEDDEDTDQADWRYSDMLLTYSGAPATTISGLDHLIGKTVWVLADGARHPDCVVSVGGSITLQLAAAKVQVGLPSLGYLSPMDLEGGSATGTAQGKIKRCHLMTIRLYRSLGGTAGPDEATQEEIRYRSPSVPMGSAPPPFTGDVDVEWPGDYSTAMRPVIVKDRPMPMAVVALMPQLVVQEGR